MGFSDGLGGVDLWARRLGVRRAVRGEGIEACGQID